MGDDDDGEEHLGHYDNIYLNIGIFIVNSLGQANLCIRE